MTAAGRRIGSVYASVRPVQAAAATPPKPDSLGVTVDGTYDVVIIGGGHNGLVAAAYLAEAGLRVNVLERRSIVGGACITEEFHPGFRASSLSYILGEFRPEIGRHLGLKELGLELIVPDPTTFGIFRDGTHVLLWRDVDRSISALERFAPRDVEAFLTFGIELKRYADLVTPTLMKAPPTLTDLDALFEDPADKRLLMDFMAKPVSDYLNERFESENLKGLLAFMSTASQARWSRLSRIGGGIRCSLVRRD